GFIGTGNMGGALAAAVCRHLDPSRVLLANRTPEKARQLANQLGCTATDNQSVAESADYIFLGVKPNMMKGLLAALADTLANRSTPFTLITMAAGLTIAGIQDMAGGDYPVIRIMPNTPAAIGEGVILYSCSQQVENEVLEEFLSAMQGAGLLSALPEQLMDAGSAVSGCGPAFVDLFIEALADGGVACGLPRASAMVLAAQMVAGSAKLVLETGAHPGALKDAVCSPGGTTIQGVRKLEEGAFRATVMNAVIAAYEKTLKIK
ncbi:MAG: pyrroline-5-carboxylate reductase, partial [Oscillospiraceae bacterium]|nr:pyrroline-5-carboxylate reductase [Oscillospiraceae bacterium]